MNVVVSSKASWSFTMICCSAFGSDMYSCSSCRSSVFYVLFLYSNQTRSGKVKLKRGTRTTHAEKPPDLHDVSIEPRQVMMEPETFGVEELEEVSC